MIKSYLASIGTPILSREDGEPLALLKDFIVNPENGKIEGIWVKPLTLPLSIGVIRSDDITEWKSSIYVQDSSAIAESCDIIRITDVLTKNARFIGNRLQNESGSYIGKAYDFDFDTQKLYLMNLYSKKNSFIFSSDRRIFSYDSIIEVFPEYILVKDEQTIKEKLTEPAIMTDQPAT